VSGFLVGLALAVPPAVMAIAAFLWVDRFEPEPPAPAGRTLRLGARSWLRLRPALVNTVTSEVLRAAGTSVEEAMSDHRRTRRAGRRGGHQGRDRAAAGAVQPARVRRRGRRGRLRRLRGVGFAFTENILYFGRAFLTGADEGLGTGFFAAGATFIARGVLSPFAHPLFTCCTGIGVGIAVTTRQPAMRLLAPLAGSSPRWSCTAPGTSRPPAARAGG
jgi:hypothetical protein